MSYDNIRQRGNVASCMEILAGLRFEKELIQQLFREDIMQESVIYQDILQQELQQGLQQGQKRESLTFEYCRGAARRLRSSYPRWGCRRGGEGRQAIDATQLAAISTVIQVVK